MENTHIETYYELVERNYEAEQILNVALENYYNAVSKINSELNVLYVETKGNEEESNLRESIIRQVATNNVKLTSVNGSKCLYDA